MSSVIAPTVGLSVLLSLKWVWSRVGGSQVVHLVPPHPGRLSRTACNRLPLHDALIETPAGLLLDGDVKRCQACVAAAGGHP